MAVADCTGTQQQTLGEVKVGINGEMCHVPLRFNIMSAMCHKNRGIGYNKKLPWPPLR